MRKYLILFLLFWQAIAATELLIIEDKTPLYGNMNASKAIQELPLMNKVTWIKGNCTNGKRIKVQYKQDVYWVKSDYTSCINDEWGIVPYSDLFLFLPNVYKKYQYRVSSYSDGTISYNIMFKSELSNIGILIRKYEGSCRSFEAKVNRINNNDNSFSSRYRKEEEARVKTYSLSNCFKNKTYRADMSVFYEKKPHEVSNAEKLAAKKRLFSINYTPYEIKKMNSDGKNSNLSAYKNLDTFNEMIAKIQKNVLKPNKYGYIPFDIDLYGEFYATCTIASLRVRKGPSTKESKVFNLTQGEKVQILGIARYEKNLKGTQTIDRKTYEIIDTTLAYWVKIRTKDGKIGYVYDPYIKYDYDGLIDAYKERFTRLNILLKTKEATEKIN